MRPKEMVCLFIFPLCPPCYLCTGTDGSGHFTSPGLATGTYYAKTERSGGYIQTLYASTTCLYCNVMSGTPIVVTSGGTTTGVDFSLTLGGRIAGQAVGVDAGGALLLATESGVQRFHSGEVSLRGGA